MTDTAQLAEKIQASGVTMTALAAKIQVSRETLYNRLAGKGEFKASEIQRVTEALHLTQEERDAIFFGE